MQFPLLRRLTADGYFTTYLQQSTEGPSRKYYKLTTQGQHQLIQLRAEWDHFYQAVNDLIDEGDGK